MGFNLNSVLGEMDKTMEQETVKVAHESISREKEKEYCVWVMPTSEGWDWLYQQAASIFMDVLMPIEYGKRRVRYSTDNKAVLTVKRQAGDARIEENSDIGFASALTFYEDGNLAHLVRRLKIDAADIPGALHWDIDMFFRVAGHPIIPDLQAFEELVATLRDSTSFGRLVKVELEVEKYELESIKDHIPFGFTEIIPGNPTDKDDQALLRYYWDVEARI